MAKLTPGTYVVYKMKHYIVVEVMGKMVKLLSPEHGKKCVLKYKVTPTGHIPAVIVKYGNTSYIVTAHFLIISLTTNKVMKWNDNHGMRIAILAKAA